jgi:hypothetical protein
MEFLGTALRRCHCELKAVPVMKLNSVSQIYTVMGLFIIFVILIHNISNNLTIFLGWKQLPPRKRQKPEVYMNVWTQKSKRSFPTVNVPNH